jgi:hypothetical protein
MPKHTPAKRRKALREAGRRAIKGKPAAASVAKAARQLNRRTEEPAPGFRRRKKKGGKK